jgi:hypothetical protein
MPSLSEVKPWGRSLTEYRAMFALAESDLSGRILDCGGGPASFNAEATDLGTTVVACDPLYEFSPDDIRTRIHETAPAIIDHVTTDRDRYVWTSFDSVEQMIETRLWSMRRFIADLPAASQTAATEPPHCPRSPSPTSEFDLAICSHLLFTYSDPLSLEFHAASIRELTRVANQAHIFPLLNSDGEPSPHLKPLLEMLMHEGYEIRRLDVAYEFQCGGNQMLVISTAT